MDTLVDDLSHRLAQRIRLERDGRGWSLADLAERSGVSKATISKIERAEVSPTAVVLVRLASAFDLTLAGLMLRAEGRGERVSRAADQPVWRDPETGYLRRQVFNRPDHPIEIIKVEMPAKQTGSPMSFQIDGKQYVVLAVSGNDGAELLAYALP